MGAWGLNTMWNWSGFQPAEEGLRKAYVASLRLPRAEPVYLGMPDVYSAAYARAVEEATAKQCAAFRDDPWLLGYFLGNEPPWPRREGEVVEMFLNGPDTATKAALRAYLAAGDTPDRRTAFIHGMFEKFLDLSAAAIKKADPNHLNLGIRFGGIPAEPILKLGRTFDVCSLNIYEYEPTAALRRFSEVTGRPLLLGNSASACRPTVWAPAWFRRPTKAKGQGIPLSMWNRRPPSLPSSEPTRSDRPTSRSWAAWTGRTTTSASSTAPTGLLQNWSGPRAKRMTRSPPPLRQDPPFAERPRASEHGTPKSSWD